MISLLFSDFLFAKLRWEICVLKLFWGMKKVDFCEEGHLGFLSPIAIDALILFPLLSVKGFSDTIIC